MQLKFVLLTVRTHEMTQQSIYALDSSPRLEPALNISAL